MRLPGYAFSGEDAPILDGVDDVPAKKSAGRSNRAKEIGDVGNDPIDREDFEAPAHFRGAETVPIGSQKRVREGEVKVR